VTSPFFSITSGKSNQNVPQRGRENASFAYISEHGKGPAKELMAITRDIVDSRPRAWWSALDLA